MSNYLFIKLFISNSLKLFNQLTNTNLVSCPPARSEPYSTEFWRPFCSRRLIVALDSERSDLVMVQHGTVNGYVWLRLVAFGCVWWNWGKCYMAYLGAAHQVVCRAFMIGTKIPILPNFMYETWPIYFFSFLLHDIQNFK